MDRYIDAHAYTARLATAATSSRPWVRLELIRRPILKQSAEATGFIAFIIHIQAMSRQENCTL